MADKFSKEKRSQIMSKIKNKRTKPEMTVHNFLKGNKVRHKMWPKIEGSPDVIIFKSGNIKKDIIVFVNGCFWHGCRLHFRLPKTHRRFWKNKIDNNIKKQKSSIRILKELEYCVIIIWEHNLR